MVAGIGGAVRRRPLRFIWVLDVSGSMEVGGKIQSLNNALSETIPLLVDDALDNPDAELTIQTLTFATAPTWLDPDPIPIEDYRWQPVQAVHQGLTELGLAIRELVPVMRQLREHGSGFAPAIVLVSDGRPTDVKGPKVEEALAELEAEPWGKASLRAAVGIGEDADMGALHAFMGNGDLQPVEAYSPLELVSMIQWVSRMVSNLASSPAGAAAATPPRPPKADIVGPGKRVWDAPTTV